ncbi:MAG: CsgG/HfaB family protein, partial [Elusimicrobiota bacterium]
MKKLVLIIAVVPLIFSACAPGISVKRQQAMSVKETERVESKYTGPKRRIGVVEFENKTAYGQGRLGGAASDILITELVKSGKFIVVERDKMNKIMEEQKFQTQGLVDAQTAVKIGKILGLEAIVVGAVSQFGVKTEGHDYLLKTGKQQTAEVTVDIRLIDVET